MTSAHLFKRIARRPYWLVLALALFLGGQVVGAQHWHNNDSNTVDYDCALCLLSGANGHAVVSSAWQAQAAPLFAFFSLFFFVAYYRSAVRFNDSRAPPALS